MPSVAPSSWRTLTGVALGSFLCGALVGVSLPKATTGPSFVAALTNPGMTQEVSAAGEITTRAFTREEVDRMCLHACAFGHEMPTGRGGTTIPQAETNNP